MILQVCNPGDFFGGIIIITSKTGLIALLGNPVEHSLSPAMHNAAFLALGLDLVYMAFKVDQDELKDAVTGLKSLGSVGANITAPYKKAVIPYLDAVSSRASALDAVNTVINREGKIIGENTDWIGCRQSLRELIPEGIAGRRVLLLGSGGAARSAGLAIALEKADGLLVANRTYARAKKLADMAVQEGISGEALSLEPCRLQAAVAESDVIVNTLPFDLIGQEWDWLYSPGVLKAKFLLDLRYTPEETILVRNARRCGAAAADGKAMLLYQGAEAFTLFTGVPAPLAVMKNALPTVV